MNTSSLGKTCSILYSQLVSGSETTVEMLQNIFAIPEIFQPVSQGQINRQKMLKNQQSMPDWSKETYEGYGVG